MTELTPGMELPQDSGELQAGATLPPDMSDNDKKVADTFNKLPGMGIAETAMHLGSSLALLPVAAGASLYHLAADKPGTKTQNAAKASSEIMNYAYQPKSNQGKAIESVMSAPSRGIQYVQDKLADAGYYRTAEGVGITGQLAPALLGPVGADMLAARAGETAGAAGETAGAAAAPSAAEAAPVSALTAPQQATLAAGRNIGMQVSRGQESNSVPLMQFEAKLDSQPWSAGPGAARRAANQTVLNRTWANALGEDANTVDSGVLSRFEERASQGFEQVRDARPRTVDPATTAGNIARINDDFEGLLPKDLNGDISNHPLVARLINETKDGQITGQQAGSISSKLGRAAAKEMTSPNGDRELGMALYRVKDHVDDLVQQGLSPSDQAMYAQLRQQYRAFMQLTARRPNLNASTGDVNGPAMAAYLQRADKNGYLLGRNTSNHYTATRFADTFKEQVGNSGTSTRAPIPASVGELKRGLVQYGIGKAYNSKILQFFANNSDKLRDLYSTNPQMAAAIAAQIASNPQPE